MQVLLYNTKIGIIIRFYHVSWPYTSCTECHIFIIMANLEYMDTKSLQVKVFSYLSGTFRIRNQFESARLISQVSGYEDREFVVAPWDLEQIALNTEARSTGEVREIIQSAAEYFIISERSGIAFVELKGDGFPPDIAGNLETHEDAEELSVQDAFKWYMYHKIQLLSEAGSKMVGVSDAVFAIKNELFLPDDFVPHEIMEMVEGSTLVSPADARSRVQPSTHDSAVYLFAKHDSGKMIEPHALYINANPGGSIPPGRDKLGGKILAAFGEFQKTGEYENFMFSRVMRNVLFTVETKKKRKLGKPLFDSSKLSLLEKKGVVEMAEGEGTIPDGITVEDLREMKRKSEESAAMVSESWASMKMDA